MRKYHVAIILRRNRLHFIYQLQELFSDYMELSSYSLEEGIKPYINCDLALVPSVEVGEAVRKYLLPHTPVQVVRRTISREGWEKICQIPAHTKVLVVNTYWQMAIQTISSLYELGLHDMKLIPFDNDGEETYEDINYAITANERDFVPAHIENVVEIGPRLVDVSSLFDILTTLNLLNNDTLAILRRHEATMIPLNPGFVEMLNQFQQEHMSVSSAMNLLEDVVLIFDADFRVHIYNQKTAEVFPAYQYQLANLPLQQLFSEKIMLLVRQPQDIRGELVRIQGKDYLLNKTWMEEKGQLREGIMVLRACDNIERQNGQMLQAMRKHGSQAKYSFQDIRGGNVKLRRALRLARKAAASDSDILIEGESGTGKELFVQSIHSASARKNGPFVAFNCAALTGSLLESELFGYEEGSFTGARRNGKRGLFETANHGTIFLDEISEIPLDIQAKLLRVLQEREFIRVGGAQTVPIDVRIIAATNQDLYELVRQKKFRLDLYFRLNVFNIKIPPLRERRDDIPDLAAFFLKQHDIREDFPQETMVIFQQYDWPGNIRELKNCIEYMVNLGEGFLPVNLPKHIEANVPEVSESFGTNEPNFIAIDGVDAVILRSLQQAALRHENVGRKRLAEQLMAAGLYFSEQSVRHKLKQMAAEGLVILSRGRGGTKITPAGLAQISLQFKGDNDKITGNELFGL